MLLAIILGIDELFIYAAMKVAGDADRRMNKED